MELIQLFHGTEQLNGRRKWHIRMFILLYELILPYVFKSDQILVGNCSAREMMGYVVDNEVASV